MWAFACRLGKWGAVCNKGCRLRAAEWHNGHHTDITPAKVLPGALFNAARLVPIKGYFFKKSSISCHPPVNTNKKHKTMETKKIEIKKDEVAVCTAEYLAEKLGVSVRHVRELRAKGVLCTTRTKSGMRYDIVNSLKGLAEHNKAKKSEKASGGIFGRTLYSFEEVRSRLESHGVVGIDPDLLRMYQCIAALITTAPTQDHATCTDDAS